MLTAPRASQASDDLDMIRGIAAFCVFLGHARNLFLVDYSQIARPSLPVKLLYFITGLGHEWVMVFFVLSGFFIASSVLKDVTQAKWSWSKYLKNRCSRLYIVLIPALLLTVFWDQLGIAYSGNSPVYQGIGEQNVIHNVTERTSLSIFAGNAFFLQSIYVPSLGSNGPLWSLSYELWYYILFPCLILVLMSDYALWKKAVCVSVAAVIYFAGQSLMPLFPVWLLGAGLAMLPRIDFFSNYWTRTLGVLLGLTAWIAALAAARVHYFENALLSDYCVGLSFALMMFFVLHNRKLSHDGVYSFIATRLAGMSYTLYLAHLPVLLFFLVFMNAERRWQPDATHLYFVSVTCLVVFFYAFALSLLTEARTTQIRQLIGKHIPVLWKQSSPLKD